MHMNKELDTRYQVNRRPLDQNLNMKPQKMLRGGGEGGTPKKNRLARFGAKVARCFEYGTSIVFGIFVLNKMKSWTRRPGVQSELWQLEYIDVICNPKGASQGSTVPSRSVT